MWLAARFREKLSGYLPANDAFVYKALPLADTGTKIPAVRLIQHE